MRTYVVRIISKIFFVFFIFSLDCFPPLWRFLENGAIPGGSRLRAVRDFAHPLTQASTFQQQERTPQQLEGKEAEGETTDEFDEAEEHRCDETMPPVHSHERWS